jgi:hypothetical protein
MTTIRKGGFSQEFCGVLGKPAANQDLFSFEMTMVIPATIGFF